MNKFLTSVNTIIHNEEFQKALITVIVQTATLVVVGVAVSAVTHGIQKGIEVGMDALTAKNEPVEVVDQTITVV